MVTTTIKYQWGYVIDGRGAQIFSSGQHVTATRRITMPKRVISYAPAVAAGLFMVIAFSMNWALAGDCLVQPNRQLAPSGHWYYRVDHVNYRKCWYLVEPTKTMAQAEAPEVQPALDATLGPTLSSFFASLSAGSMGAKPAGTQQDATKGAARPIQTRPDDLKNGSRSKLARVARHPDSNTAPTFKLNRQSPTGPQMARTNQPPPLDQAGRDALFEEFLRWNARQIP
jgi:hypothetical protein